MRKILIASVVLALGACNNEPSATNESSARPANNLEAKECYAGYAGEDSIFLMATVEGNKVLGTLRYAFHEKDNSSGNFVGRMKIDTLIADYTYISEGVNSVRQIAFLEKNGRLIEGYGELVEKDGKMIFRNTDSLQFGRGFVLDKTTCK
jgi:hypothetical protein